MHEPRPVVVFAGGGTGGHVYPALALAEALVRVRPGIRPFFVGAARGVEARIFPSKGVEHVLLPVEGLQRGAGLRSLRVLPRLGVSLLHVADLFQELRPEAVVVTGGYAGGPAGIGAGLAGIPLVLQEGNAVPGVTTRLLSRWARQVHVAFPEASDHLPAAVRSRVIVSGNPVRTPPRLTREEARRAFDLPADALVVLVSGGSQGAAALNRVLLEAVEAVAAGAADRPPGLRLLWSTGPRHHREVTDRLKTLGEPHWVLALPYIDDMLVALAGADLAVSRAGAISTAELLNQGLPAILVPLPTAAADHQRRNAEALAAAGAALLAPEESLTGEALWVQVLGLAGDSARRDAMSTAARDRARPKAAAEIATAVTRLMEGTWSA